MSKHTKEKNLRDQLIADFQKAGLKFERYNGDNDQLWFSPHAQRLILVPLQISKAAYDSLRQVAGLQP